MVYSCGPNIGIIQITSLQTVPLFRVGLSLESDLTNPLLGYIERISMSNKTSYSLV